MGLADLRSRAPEPPPTTRSWGTNTDPTQTSPTGVVVRVWIFVTSMFHTVRTVWLILTEAFRPLFMSPVL